MEPQIYRTVARQGEEEFVIHKSRFIGHAAPVDSEAAALQFLSQMRARYKDASHNCYAYIIGKNAGIQRYSDDGEPSGTAGLPIIQVLKRREVVDVAVVVTRYFGGVLLGAAGLIRAYAQGAAVGLDAAQVVAMHPTRRYGFDAEYAMVGKLDHWLAGLPVLLHERAFAQQVTYELSVKQADAPEFLRQLTEVGQGRLEPVLLEEGYRPWPERPEIAPL